MFGRARSGLPRVARELFEPGDLDRPPRSLPAPPSPTANHTARCAGVAPPSAREGKPWSPDRGNQWAKNRNQD